MFAWTDSTVVLSWLSGSPRHFKVFVGNHVSNILELLPPDSWHRVAGRDNPADAGSRGMLPSELLEHELWWVGPSWLHQAELHGKILKFYTSHTSRPGCSILSIIAGILVVAS